MISLLIIIIIIIIITTTVIFLTYSGPKPPFRDDNSTEDY